MSLSVALLPGGEVNKGDGDGVTRNKGVTAKQKNLKKNVSSFKSCAYIGDAFLNASGCINLMWSPLSQVILARLDFRI